jgi:TonB family protein
MTFRSKKEKNSLTEKRALKEKSALNKEQFLKGKQTPPGNFESSGSTEDDQKGFWIMFIFSLCLHLLFFLYMHMVPIPSSSPSREPTLDAVPDRFVKLIIKSSSLNSLKEQKENREQEEIQASIQKEVIKPAPVKQPPPPAKEAQQPKDTQTAKEAKAAKEEQADKAAKAEQQAEKEQAAAKKEQAEEEQAAKKEQTAKEKQSANKEQLVAEQEKKTGQKPSSAKDSDKNGKPKSPPPSSTGTPQPSLVAATAKEKEEDTGGKKVEGERSGASAMEGKTPVPPPKKKIDLKSIGILGMMSSSKSSQSSSSSSSSVSSTSSSSTIDSQLSVLARNAVSGGDILARQIKKADPPGNAFAGEERNDELPAGKGGAGKSGSKKGGDTGHGDTGQGGGGEGTEGAGKSEAMVVASAKKINDLVAMHQKTDTVQLPVKGDLALQKIVDIKTSGPKSQSRTSDAIFEVVSSYKSSIVHCYNKALKQYSRLEGRVVIEFTITAQGDVSKAEVVSSSLEKTNSGMEDCLISMIRSWHFAPIPLGTTTVVVYPFVFFPTM